GGNRGDAVFAARCGAPPARSRRGTDRAARTAELTSLAAVRLEQLGQQLQELFLFSGRQPFQEMRRLRQQLLQRRSKPLTLQRQRQQAKAPVRGVRPALDQAAGLE